jgi:hypothetical protein
VVLEDQALDRGPALGGRLVDEVVLAALAVHLDHLDRPPRPRHHLVEGDGLDADAGALELAEGQVVVPGAGALQVEDGEAGLSRQRLLVHVDPVVEPVVGDVAPEELEGVRRRLEAVDRGRRVELAEQRRERADVGADVEGVDGTVDELGEEPPQVVGVVGEHLVRGHAGARRVRDRDHLPATGVEGQRGRALGHLLAGQAGEELGPVREGARRLGQAPELVADDPGAIRLRVVVDHGAGLGPMAPIMPHGRDGSCGPPLPCGRCSCGSPRSTTPRRSGRSTTSR